MAGDMAYKVLITTSGTGSRLGDITKYTNKSLVKVGKKPAISYIIEAYPKNTEFVITVGYFGNQVRDFLKLVYPEKNFKFVEVDKYEGKGSSLGYSMLQAASQLQCPFIYHACDTIISGKILKPKKNWIGGFLGEGSSHYASFDVVDGKVQQMYDKGMIDPDFLHIGLIGVQEYKSFWENLKELHRKNPTNGALNDVEVISKMIGQGSEFGVVPFEEWYDIGNVESLHKARVEIEDSFRILDKSDESIFIFDKFVVKFFYDEKTVAQRVERGRLLRGLAPEIEGSTKNFYRYKYANGKLYSKVATPIDFGTFLRWSKKNLWKPNREVSDQEFKKICYDFYYKKTVERVEKFLVSRKVKDAEIVINGEKVPTIKKMLKMIDFDWLCNAKQSGFHGDFILDNLLKKGKSGYVLLDWRQNFGGLLKSGDMYYDLSKLNHNLTVNHEIVNNDLFKIEIEKDEVTCDIHRKENLVQCQKALFEFLQKNGYDTKKVKILTALIWLNMSPLHHHPFDLFLFYFGKLNLWRALNEK
ncbi:MAG: nucleoside-diphosphate-sugar pyrophosphorylase [Candidatus Moranbacteria bacterium]|nr:nucleoside-diphosphate-sugar pyrophosphorylase [Candidatus Moranbacteria bacterium]MDD3964939.1 nucleoside-diphosphate-sugar pyrophosphorylase [Candidatus Moranbacteria bacterium]